FFFQAEDGIRDFHVTGVQTCTLPIWAPPKPTPHRARTEGYRVPRRSASFVIPAFPAGHTTAWKGPKCRCSRKPNRSGTPAPSRATGPPGVRGRRGRECGGPPPDGARSLRFRRTARAPATAAAARTVPPARRVCVSSQEERFTPRSPSAGPAAVRASPFRATARGRPPTAVSPSCANAAAAGKGQDMTDRRGNGLLADSYVPLALLPPVLADTMLEALGRAGIAAYAVTVGAAAPPSGDDTADEAPTDHLYVDAKERAAAEAVRRAELPELADRLVSPDPAPARPESENPDEVWADLVARFYDSDTAERDWPDAENLSEPSEDDEPDEPDGPDGPVLTS